MTVNLFDDIPATASAELFTELLVTRDVRIERIVSTGQASPEGFWYDEPRAEWVVLLAGAAGLRFEGEAEIRVLRRGDHLDIPAHRRHRVEWTEPGATT